MRIAVALAAVLPLATAACVVDGAATTDDSEHDVAGTPDELALTRFLNDGATTVDVLDVQVALDSRAARNLIAHRNGPDGVFGNADDDHFDSAAEVDAVPYVGATALTRMIAFADAHGYVQDGELFGTFDGVSFTVAEARASITYVNTATQTTLHDGIKLDSRAVSSILAARPIASLATLSSLYYVGGTALTKIKLASEPAPTCTDDALVASLAAACKGMLLLSESDREPVAMSWPNGAGKQDAPAAFLQLLNLPATTSIVPDTYDHMLERYGYESTPEQVAALKALLDGLTDLHVWQVGTIEVQDYIVGTSPCGGLVGVMAISIET